MRFDELVIERYGAIEARRIDLAGPGLTVVYGPNEAGKSTCLAAVTDFLFRIPEKTTRIGRFGADVARVGARVRTADGRVLDLKRRYGRVRTLIDDKGAACDESVLAALLGSTTRDRFETLFGLDHEALRRGGEVLLRADGDVGRLIVEAGGGLRALMGQLDEIDAEIDGLFSPRKAANRLFYKALRDYETAEKTIRASTLTRDAYERDRKTHQGASVAQEESRTIKRQLSERLSELQRIERTIPVLRQLDDLDAKLAGFADVSALSREFPEWTNAAYAAVTAARADLEKARFQQKGMSERTQAMQVDEALVGVEAAARDITARVAVVEAARGSRENRHKELGDAEVALAVLRHRLGVGPETDLEPRMPPAEVIDRIRGLAAAAASRASKLTVARDAVEDANDKVETAKARMADLAVAGRARPFGMAVADFVSLPAEAATVDRKRSKAETLERTTRRRLSSLGFDDVDELSALPFPPDELIRSEIEQRNLGAAELTRQVAARAAAETQRDMARGEEARLCEEGVVATPEVLAEVRRQRDVAWQPIRAAYASPIQDLPVAERGSKLAVFEAGLAEADRVADARVIEAQRVAALIEARRRLQDAEAAIEAVTVAERRLGESLTERTAAFARAYPEACKLVLELPSLLAFAVVRTDALSAAATAQDAQAEGDEAVQLLAPRLRLLSVAEERGGLKPSGTDDVVSRVHALTKAIAEHERDYAEHEREQAARASHEAKLVTARRTLSAIEGEEEAWEAEWAVATAALGIPASTAPAIADELAVRWDAARGDLRAIAQTQRRLARMDEDEADLASRIDAVRDTVGFALPGDPVAAGKMLADRWGINEGVRLAKAALAPDLEASADTVTVAEQALEKAEEDFHQLRAAAGHTHDDAALREAAARRQDLSTTEADRGKLVDAARTAGDGLDIASLRANAEGQDLDAVRAEIADVRGRIDAADNEIEATIRLEQQAATALAAHEGPSRVGLATVEREAALVEMHVAVERYVELKLARGLLDRAIQQVRGEQQDPLVKEAGRLFAHMTLGEFEGVAADVDAKGAPVVVGLRSGTRASQPVATMSDGTRDQLFLAFRLASLANYAAAAEPLPFVADDILVHFDDERGAATLDLLASFAATTQVLLFTHHRSVLAAAEQLVAVGRASIADFRPN